MTDPSKSAGWSDDPSAWPRRILVSALAIAGCGIATYLGLYQLGVFPHVWEPFFGTGSDRILKQSSIAHLLPFPDALLGAGVYLLDVIAGAIGGRDRWRTMPWIVLLHGSITAALGLGGVLLAISQPVFFHAFCTLCLASAACSICMAGLLAAEVRASMQSLARQRTQKRGHMASPARE